MRITVDSPLGPEAFTFERLEANEVLGRSYQYDVHLLSNNRAISLSKLLGELLTVHVEISPQLTRHFGGHITKATALGGHGRSARYQLELRPWLALLRHNATCRIWQNATVVDVLKDVAAKAGFTLNVASHGIMAGRSWEYLVQYRESDYNFFMRLLEQEGYYFYIRQNKDNHEILLMDDLSDHESSDVERRIPFQPPGSRTALAEDVFDTWTVSEQLRTTHYELDDYDFTQPRQDLFARSGDPAQPAPASGSAAPPADRVAVVYDYPGEYTVLGDGNQLTNFRQQELRVDRHAALASGNVRDLSAGSIFTLSSHTRTDQNRKYAVTSMRLTLEAPQVESGKEGGGDAVVRGSYTLLDAGLPYRLTRESFKPVISGPQTAVVVGPKEEEIHTDPLGRVRVKFRWDRTGMESKEHTNQGEEAPSPEDSSCWIRVAQPWASSGFGFQFIPRVGDEVVVQFLEGDPDRPLIMGSVYNGTNKPPFTLAANKTQSGIKTRSSKHGGPDNANEIRFEDLKGEEELFVQAERNHTVKVKADRSVSVGGNESHSVTGKRDTTITKKNTDTYQDEHEMTVTKKVNEVFLDEHSLAVQKKQTIEIQNDKSEYVDLGYELTTKGKFLLTQGTGPGAGTTMKFEGKAVDLNILGPFTIVRGEGAIRIDGAGMITIESSLGISLVCGGSKVELTPAGVSVSGTMVKINS